GNLTTPQIAIGALAAAEEENLRRSIAICKGISERRKESHDHIVLGWVLAYQGRFNESEAALSTASDMCVELGDTQGQTVLWAYRALRALLMGDADAALEAACQARELADVERVERDIIRAEWLLGAAYRARGDMAQAEPHLEEALRRCRRINLVEREPDILLELARLRYAQAGGKVRRTWEALAQEALEMADRCGYRLKQADCHNFLAQVALAADDLSEARRYAETGRERAWCDGPGHRYEVAFREAERLLGEVESR
ncbi:MAG: hypothetical protein V3S14_06610, partial [Anaerolineae bacterium]